MRLPRPLLVVLFAAALPCLSEAQQRLVPIPREHLPKLSDQQALHFFDADSDGDLDLLIGGERKDTLLLQEDALTFRDASAQLPATLFDTKTRCIDSGDVDGDGDLDLVLGGDLQTRLYLNDGKGVFKDATKAAMPRDSVLSIDLSLRDLDGDKTLDLILVNTDLTKGVQNYVYLGSGTGSFKDVTATHAPALLDRSHELAVADLDQDGDLDAVFSRWHTSDAAPQIWINDGKGKFRLENQRLSPASKIVSQGQCVADLDQDGDVDLLFASSQPRIFLNDGKGSFVLAPASLLPMATPWFSGPLAGALDGDGVPYVLGMGLSSDALRAWRKQSASFVEVSSEFPPLISDWLKLELVDLQQDGDLDLCLLTRSLGPLLYVNSSTRPSQKHGSWVALQKPRVGEYRGAFLNESLLTDVDGDGKLDFLYPPRGIWRQEGLLLADGRGRLQRYFPRPFPSSYTYESDLTVNGDLDGDGDIDCIVPFQVNLVGGQLQLLLYGRGRWRDSTSGRLPTLVAASMRNELSDLEGDGDLDLIYFRELQGSWGGQVFLNDGSATFTELKGAFTSLPGQPVRFFARDFDADGDQDLIGSFLAPGPKVLLELLVNDGKGRFKPAPSTSIPAAARTSGPIAAGDMNGDQKLDVLLIDSSYSLQLLLGDGQGGFQIATSGLPTGLGTIYDGSAGDLEGDGDLDLALRRHTQQGSRILPNLILLENDGKGRFVDVTSSWTDAKMSSLSPVILRDLDGDGDGDLIADHEVRWNRTQHVSTPQFAVLGDAWTLQISRDPGQLTGTCAALPLLGFVDARIEVPGLGTLGIRPDTLIPGVAQMLPAPAGVARVQTPLPSDASLAGLEMHVQALLWHAPASGPAVWRLTNTLSERLRR